MHKFPLGLIVAAVAVGLGACSSAEDDTPTVRLTVEAAPAVTRPPAVKETVPDLTEAASDKIETIKAIIERNSLRRFANLANQEPSFVSNFAGEDNRVHWDLLRRTGFDPLAQLGLLLEGPYGIRQVGDEVWYIWPDLAALEPEDLKPEKLSFSDRARLTDLVGELGIERIRSGQGYPGVRAAIADDGRWLYFIHEAEDEAETP